MSEKERADLEYDPAVDNTHLESNERLIELATKSLADNDGVKGIGLTKTAAGKQAIQVFIASESARAALPTTIEGIEVQVEVTGDISIQ